MKVVYFVLSPESAGNRLLVRSINSAYDFGNGGVESLGEGSYQFHYKWFNPGLGIRGSLEKAPDRVIFSRSIPRGSYPKKEWPNLCEICTIMQECGYEVVPIVSHRELEATAQSQVQHHHVREYNEASLYIHEAYQLIFSSLAKMRLQPIMVKYEELISDAGYRAFIFIDLLGLKEPTLEYFDANDKYTTNVFPKIKGL